ncbi:MAG: ATP-binding protein [Nodosilinea sp.]
MANLDSQRAPDSTQPEVLPQTRTVLIVDRDPEGWADAYQYLLQPVGGLRYRWLTERYDGPVLDLCQRQDIDALILVDGGSEPGGCELIGRLQAQLGCNLPIIVVGDNDIGQAKRALRAGAADYLVCDQLTAATLAQALALAIPSPNLIPTQDFADLQQQLRVTAAALDDSRDELGRRSHLFDAVLSTITDFVYLFDRDGRFVFVNQPLLDLWGLTLAETVGKNFFDLNYPDALAAKHQQEIERVFVTGETVKDESVYVSPKGVSGVYEYIFTPLRSPAGGVTSVVGSTRNITNRKLAEVALRESEEKYRTLFTSIDQGYFLVDVIFDENDQPIDIVCLETNAAAIEIVGEDFTGRQLSELSLMSGPHWYNIFGQVVRTGQGERLEEYAELKQKWYDFYISKVGDDTSRRVAVIFQNITRRKRREANAAFLSDVAADFARLSAADEIMQVIGAKIAAYLGLSACAFVEIDDANNTAVVDYAWHGPKVPNLVGTYRLSEFVTDELLRAARNQESVVVFDTNTDWRTVAEKYAALNINAFVSVPFHKDGVWKFSLNIHTSRPRKWHSDEIKLIQELSNQIFPRFERVRVEAALQKSEERFRFSTYAIDGMVYDWDVQTGQVYRSEGLHQLTGLYPDAVPAVTNWWKTRIHPEDHEGIDAKIALILAGTDDRYEFEYRVRHEAGHWVNVWDRGYLIHNPQGQLVRVVGSAIDITDRKRAEQEREQLLAREQAARGQAEAANRVKDEFLAVVSHELRSPLNPILGWSKLLLSRQLSEPKKEYALEVIERNAQIQAQLINDLLDVSRILRGKLSLNKITVNLGHTIQAALETVQLAAEAKSIQIGIEIDPARRVVAGDADRLQQVVWNLLSNAVKFTPPEGQVSVRLEYLDPYAQITVTDTGRGIHPDFLPLVFDRFRQEDATTTRQFGGLGLGLALVRYLVELHGGRVKADSAGEGHGATFTVQLPLLPSHVTTEQEHQAAKPLVDLKDTQILMVDDDGTTREFIAFFLELQGARVITAASAEEAIAAVIRFRPDIMLSDIGMPDMDGYMLMRQVRSLAPEQGGQVPAIALTAYAGEIDYRQAIAAGFQKHMTKPIELDQLMVAIAELMA